MFELIHKMTDFEIDIEITGRIYDVPLNSINFIAIIVN